MSAFLTLMKAFLFFSRVGFLLNLVFIVCVVLRYQPAELFSQSVVSILLISGWFLSVLVNAILHVQLLALVLMGNRSFSMPLVLVFNLLVFIFQIVYFFLL